MNAGAFSACAEKLEKQGTFPEIGPFLIRKFRDGKLKGDELEVARRFLEACSGDTPHGKRTDGGGKALQQPNPNR